MLERTTCIAFWSEFLRTASGRKTAVPYTATTHSVFSLFLRLASGKLSQACNWKRLGGAETCLGASPEIESIEQKWYKSNLAQVARPLKSCNQYEFIEIQYNPILQPLALLVGNRWRRGRLNHPTPNGLLSIASWWTAKHFISKAR